jgi:hypothetical protein
LALRETELERAASLPPELLWCLERWSFASTLPFMSKNAMLAAFHAGHFIRETEKDIVSDYRYFLNDRSAATGLPWIKKWPEHRQIPAFCGANWRLLIAPGRCFLCGQSHVVATFRRRIAAFLRELCQFGVCGLFLLEDFVQELRGILTLKMFGPFAKRAV